MNITAVAYVKELRSGELEGLGLESFRAARAIVARATFLQELHVCLEASAEEKAHPDFPSLATELLLANDFEYPRELTFVDLYVQPEAFHTARDRCAGKLKLMVLYNVHLFSSDHNAWTALIRSMESMPKLSTLRMAYFYQRHEEERFKIRFPYSSDGRNIPRRYVSFNSADEIRDGLPLLLTRGLRLKAHG